MQKLLMRTTAILYFSVFGGSLQASPEVVADIAPVHSLVAQVMKGLGEPFLIIPAEQDPHNRSLRPSQAKEIEKADIVFWMGEDMSPWLEETFQALAPNAHTIELLEHPVTIKLPFREEVVFDDEDDHADHKDHEEHGHDDHAEHKDHEEHGHDDHNDHKDHEEHGHDDHDEHKDHEEHGHDDHHHHGENDPHAWLEPDNAIAWLNVIAEELSEHDPDNAALYQENAKEGQKLIRETASIVSSQLAETKNKKYVVFHDAFQYFSKSFDVPIVASLAVGDATAPSAARVKQIQTFAQENAVSCAFAEPQQSTKILTTTLGETGLAVKTLDPLGAKIEPGATLYTELLSQLSQSILECED